MIDFKINTNKEIKSSERDEYANNINSFISEVHKHNRIIMLNSDITMESAIEVHAKILDLRNADQKEPIALYVSSQGGGVGPGLWLANEIECSETPIVTLCPSYALSAATLVFMAGHLRLVFPHSMILFHGMSNLLYGNVEQIGEQFANTDKVKNKVVDFISKHCKIPRKQINEIITKDKELYLLGEEAIEYGVADDLFQGVAILPERQLINKTLFVIKDKEGKKPKPKPKPKRTTKKKATKKKGKKEETKLNV